MMIIVPIAIHEKESITLSFVMERMVQDSKQSECSFGNRVIQLLTCFSVDSGDSMVHH